MVGFAIGLLMGGFIGVCFAEPYCRLIRSISGEEGLFADPGLTRFMGWIAMAGGLILFCVHLYRD